MRTTVCAMSLGLMLCARLAVPAAMWYVDASVPKAGDGTSWEKALKKIQAGIDKAADGDTVIVAQGTYVENINFKGKNIVLTSTNPTDWRAVKQTIIDGNKSGSTVTFDGTENETCVLSGFTVTNGYAFVGGGILGAGSMVVPTGATISNNMVIGNHAYGGGDYGGCGGLWACAGRLENNIIAGNLSDQWGGGVGAMEGVMVNCLIVGNSAYQDGGVGWSHGTFQNCTICWNRATDHGGGIAHYNPPIQNCIIWGNTATNGPQFYDVSSTPTYSCIEGWTGGAEGNIALNPGFVDPDGPDNNPQTLEDNDYRLLPGSPCIDVGVNEDWMATAVDMEGNPRILAGISSLTVDMGAYEYRFRISGIRIVPATGGPELSWESRRMVWYGVWSCTDPSAGLWNSQAEVVSKGDVMIWTDPATSSIRKFYRVEIR